MTIRQKNGLWNYVDLLSLATAGLNKSVSNPSTWDADSDLCLRSLLSTTTDKVSFSFTSPATSYQFIEIDAVSVGDVCLFRVAASTNSTPDLGLLGEIAIASFLVTPGTTRTFRLPFIGEIESFIFWGFTSLSPVNIKEIRFYSTPSSLRLSKAPQTTDLLEPNTAYLVADDLSVLSQTDGRYKVVLAPDAVSELQAVFTMDMIDVSHGRICVSVSQGAQYDVIFNVTDQTGLSTASTSIEIYAGYFEVFVTSEYRIVQILATNTSGTNSIDLCIELDNFKAIKPSNAFGVFETRVISPLSDSLRVL